MWTWILAAILLPWTVQGTTTDVWVGESFTVAIAVPKTEEEQQVVATAGAGLELTGVAGGSLPWTIPPGDGAALLLLTYRVTPEAHTNNDVVVVVTLDDARQTWSPAFHRDSPAGTFCLAFPVVSP